MLRDPVEAEDAAQQTFLSAAGDELQRDVGRREEIQALCAALTELPPQQRDAVVLREFYGLSYAEVAAALGLSGAAVESLLFRGRKRLQKQLRSVRSALGVLTLPVTLRDSLAQALPGFGAGAASTGAGGAVLAKLASAPITAKLAAATLAVGTVGTVASVEQSKHFRPHRSAAPARKSTTSHARVKPVALAVRTSEPLTVRPVAVQPVALRTGHVRAPASAGHEARDGQQGTGGAGGGGEVEQEHRSAPATITTTSGDDGGGGGSSGGGSSGSANVSGGTSHDGGGDSGSGGSGGSGDRGATGESGHDGGSGSGGSGTDG